MFYFQRIGFKHCLATVLITHMFFFVLHFIYIFGFVCSLWWWPLVDFLYLRSSVLIFEKKNHLYGWSALIKFQVRSILFGGVKDNLSDVIDTSLFLAMDFSMLFCYIEHLLHNPIGSPQFPLMRALWGECRTRLWGSFENVISMLPLEKLQMKTNIAAAHVREFPNVQVFQAWFVFHNTYSKFLLLVVLRCVIFGLIDLEGSHGSSTIFCFMFSVQIFPYRVEVAF